MENPQNYYTDNLNNTNPQQPAPPKKSGGFAIASMICGIVSLVLCCLGIGLPFGALAVLFAILTRRKKQHMDPLAVVGIVAGIVGMILGTTILLSTIDMISDPYFQRGMYDSIEEEYGEEMADSVFEMYGFDLDEIKDLDLQDIY